MTALGLSGVLLDQSGAYAAEEAQVGDVGGPIDAPDVADATSCCGTPLERHCAIRSATTYSESIEDPRCWSYNPTFYDRLQSWYDFWSDNTPASFSVPKRIYGYGAYVCRGDGCTS